jgi:Transposase DDE domain group 1
MEIELRADAGFAVPAIYEFCEAEGIHYTIALITNSRLEQMAASLLKEAKHQHEQPGQKVRLLSEGRYRAGSWESERRVVYKAEVMEEGINTRFVVTNKPEEPEELYEHYTERAETENRIKDLKVALKADRLSCQRFLANQFRLLLHAAAYWLMDTLRRKVRLHLASGHPGQRLWDTLMLGDATAS